MKSFYFYIQCVVILLCVILLYYLDPVVSSIFPSCPLLSITGLFCPGCGSLRAMHALLHGQFTDVISLNFLFLPALGFLMIEAVIHFTRKMHPHVRYLSQKEITPYVTLTMILAFWILRNIPVQPFASLAPH